jgi:HSP20 family protein
MSTAAAVDHTDGHHLRKEGHAAGREYDMEGVGAMLMRTDPFRELDRLSQQLFGQHSPGTWSRPSPMPIDAYRVGDKFVVEFDLPGVAADAIELHVERNVLTVKAERRPTAAGDQVEMQLSERPLGVFSRQLFLGDTLDTEHIAADYNSGVLTLRIPVAEKAKPRKIEIAGEADTRSITV